MNSFLLKILLLSIALLSFNLSFGAPNIVLMISDDQGWDGLSVKMHPNIDNSKSDLAVYA